MISSGRFGIVLFVVCSVTLAETRSLKSGNNQYSNSHCARIVDEDPSTCSSPAYLNICGKTSCPREPKEFCDVIGPFRYGVCAEGLICGRCGRCVGCHGDNCFSDTMCPYPHLDRKIIRSYPMEFSNNYIED